MTYFVPKYKWRLHSVVLFGTKWRNLKKLESCNVYLFVRVKSCHIILKYFLISDELFGILA